MELLTDELDGFNKALDKLQQLTRNVEDIRIMPDTSEIEKLLENHLQWEKEKTLQLQESVRSLKERLAKASIVPKLRLWLHYFIWGVSLLIIGYLSFKVSKIEELREESYSNGQQEINTSLRDYFDEYPESLKTYQEWAKEENSTPKQK